MNAQFTGVFDVLHRYIGDGEDNADFVARIIAMLTKEPVEDSEKTRTDSTNAQIDLTAGKSMNTLRGWRSRGIPKKEAGAILGRWNSDPMFNCLADLEESIADKLVADLRPYMPTITSHDCAQTVCDWFEDYCYTQSGQKRAGDDQIAEQTAMSLGLKKKFGAHLLREAESTCMNPNCSRLLVMVNASGKATDIYEAVLIDPKKSSEIFNVAALCNRCARNHLEASTRRTISSLARIKAQLSTALKMRDRIGESSIEKGLAELIVRLKGYRASDQVPDISFDVVEVERKIDENLDPFLFHEVREKVTAYYTVVHSIFQDLHASGEIDVEVLRHDVKSDYLRLRDQPRQKVLEVICKKINSATRAEMFLCAIVASYFVQTCDVFEPLTQKVRDHAPA